MDKCVIDEKINFDGLIQEYQIRNVTAFVLYLKDIYRYYDLPGLISQRFFAVLDKDRDDYLSIKEFVEGMVYDFDKDGLISKEDIRTVMSYLTLNPKTHFALKSFTFQKNTYTDRVESQVELQKFLDIIFKTKKLINENEFMTVIEEVNSDIFLFLLIFLYENRPFTKENLQQYENSNDNLSLYYNKANTSEFRPIYKFIKSPNLNSKFLTSITLSKSPLLISQKNKLKNSNTLNQNESLRKLKISELFNKNANINSKQNFLLKYTNKSKLKTNEDQVIIENVARNANKSDKLLKTNFKIKSYGEYLQRIKNIEEDKFTKLKEKENNSDTFFAKDFDSKINLSTLIKVHNSSDNITKIINEIQAKDSNLLKKTNNHPNIYQDYKYKEDKKHFGMHNLSGVFINEGKKTPYSTNIDDFSFYSFSVTYPNKARFYFVEDKEEYYKWLHIIRKVTGYKNLKDIYDFGEVLGNGRFGLVQIAKDKINNRDVAIKTIRKTNLTSEDLELIRTEVEILKICQHPNIIRLYDVYESIEDIYIIMEVCTGGDLFTYLEKRNFRLSETKTKRLVKKLCDAILYIHTYGITHRDLKPENIIMTDDSEDADIRLLDFGLGKIIGPNEFCYEPFGTLTYVAPEILLERPYSKQVDMWSLGIITYLMLTGNFPFYDEQYEEEEIARQTIEDPVIFRTYVWRKFTPQAKDFVQNLLVKNPDHRMDISQALKHPWLNNIYTNNHETFTT